MFNSKKRVKNQTENPPNGTILVVDDTPANLRLMSQMLSEAGHKVRVASNGAQAIKSVEINPPDLIFLDVVLPDMNGYEICQHLMDSGLLNNIPVIFISALAETEDKVNAFLAGGVDYVTKPFQTEEVLARTTTHLALQNARRQLEVLATTDPLTEILNRRQFFNLAELELKRASRYNHSTACIMLDIDDFKNINDQYGHLAGDTALKHTAATLQGALRPADIFARYGGDEFIIFLPEANLSQAQQAAKRLHKAVTNQRVIYQGEELNIKISMGVSSTTNLPSINLEALINIADQALYAVKNTGGNNVKTSKGI